MRTSGALHRTRNIGSQQDGGCCRRHIHVRCPLSVRFALLCMHPPAQVDIACNSAGQQCQHCCPAWQPPPQSNPALRTGSPRSWSRRGRVRAGTARPAALAAPHAGTARRARGSRHRAPAAGDPQTRCCCQSCRRGGAAAGRGGRRGGARSRRGGPKGGARSRRDGRRPGLGGRRQEQGGRCRCCGGGCPAGAASC